MSTNNKDRQAAFKQRMRLAGKKQITIWVTPKEEQLVRGLLNKDGSPQPREELAEDKKRSVTVAKKRPKSPDIG
jgi:hypothetical protein